MTRNQRRPKQQKLKQKETITMKTKLTKMIMSSLAFACASVCLAAAMALGTSATARAAADARVCNVGMLRGLYLSTFDGYAKRRWEPRTESRYGRPTVQRRWYDAQYLRHGEHRGHDYFRRHRSGRNLYGRTGLHRHALTVPGIAPTLIYTSGRVHSRFGLTQICPRCWHGSGLGVGTAARLP